MRDCIKEFDVTSCGDCGEEFVLVKRKTLDALKSGEELRKIKLKLAKKEVENEALSRELRKLIKGTKKCGST